MRSGATPFGDGSVVVLCPLPGVERVEQRSNGERLALRSDAQRVAQRERVTSATTTRPDASGGTEAPMGVTVTTTRQKIL